MSEANAAASQAAMTALRDLFYDSVLDHFGEHYGCGDWCSHREMERRTADAAWTEFQMEMANHGWRFVRDQR